MAANQPDPGEFLEMAQRMLRQFFGEQRTGDDDEPWADATRRGAAGTSGGTHPTPQRQRENLTFALATRAVEALEDVALNVAAIRQRLERLDAQAPGTSPGNPQSAPEGPDAGAPGGPGS